MEPTTDGMFRRIWRFIALYAVILLIFAASLRYNQAASEVHGSTPTSQANDADSEAIASAAADLSTAAGEPRAESDEDQQNAIAADENVIEAFDIGKSPLEDLFLPVKIEGQNWWFVVDSGASYTVVDVQVAMYLGMVDQHASIGPGSFDRHYPLPEACIGRSRIPVDCEVRCFDLWHLRFASHNSPICGILGADFLRSHVITIDLDTGKLSFLKSAPDSPGDEFSLSRDRYDRPLLKIDLAENESGWFLLDTGCVVGGAGAIEAETFTSLVDQNQLTMIADGVPCFKFFGMERCRMAFLKRFHVGGFEHANLRFLDDHHVNLLGLGYLSRYIATIDFPRDRLYLKKSLRFAKDPGRTEPQQPDKVSALVNRPPPARPAPWGWNDASTWLTR